MENPYVNHMGYQRLIKTRFRSLYNCFSSGKWKIRLGYRVCIHHQIYIIIYYMRYHTHTNRIVGSREKYIWYKKNLLSILEIREMEAHLKYISDRFHIYTDGRNIPCSPSYRFTKKFILPSCHIRQIIWSYKIFCT